MHYCLRPNRNRENFHNGETSNRIIYPKALSDEYNRQYRATEPYIVCQNMQEGTPNCVGIVPRAIEAIFEQAAESNHSFMISFSMLEIYIGNLKDLLIPQTTKPTDPLPPW